MGKEPRPPVSRAAPSQRQSLTRRLGTADATLIGLGSMVGAGVFAAFTPAAAAAAAGSGLLVGLAVAGLVAFCNATSSAQLAAVYPASGGTYVYGRERLGPWPGLDGSGPWRLPPSCFWLPSTTAASPVPPC